MRISLPILLLFTQLVLVPVVGLPQSLSIRAARSFLPGDHVSLRYEHWTNSSLNLSGGVFMEKSRKNLLDFSAYGAEVLSEYATNREGFSAGPFGLRAGLGLTWQTENEKWVYSNWTTGKRSGFGVVGEVNGEWFMTEHFSLRLVLQQRWIVNPSIGKYRFLAGIGLVYNLNSY